MFLAIFGYFYLKEKVSLTLVFISIILAMMWYINYGWRLSFHQVHLFGNLVALAIPINFSILVMIIRKNSNLDMVPAIFYSGIFSLHLWSFFMTESFDFLLIMTFLWVFY